MFRRALPALLALAGLAAFAPAAGADAGPGLWSPAAQPHGRGATLLRPARARASTIDRAGLAAALHARSLTIALPAPAGGFDHFAVRQAPVMAPSLVRRYPQIRALAGRGIEHPAETVRVDIGPLGFHASVRGPRGAWYIDPADARAPRVYLSYFGRDAAPGARFVERSLPGARPSRSAAAVVPATTPLRTYRLALLSDNTYAAYFGATTDAQVLAAKTALINRVDQVYEEELGVRLELIAGTDTALNFSSAEMTGGNGPCGAQACFSSASAASCDVSTLEDTGTTLGQVVGASAFDIGHIVLGNQGGGIADLGVVGGDFKAWGCTGVPTPTGDLFAIDYVAHEMGHQFGADHPFDGTQDSCGPGNRNPATSVEPGSGSSIMGYAGICGLDDLQPHSDPYFSQRSYEQIADYTYSTQPAANEVQNIGLRGFNGTDSFQLSYGGGSPSAVITNGSNYTKAGLEAAIFAITGSHVTVDVFGHSGELDNNPPSNPGPQGFQVTFDRDALAGTDAAQLTVVNPSGLTGSVPGETEQGGPVENHGTDVPASSDTRPVVVAPPARSIPARTPFSLTGSATDADNDPLTYMWEQNDVGGASGTPLASNLRLRGPLFRQFGTAAQVSQSDSLLSPSPGENAAGTSPTRDFPDMTQILAGNTNAATGTCPAVPAGATSLTAAQVNCFSEFLPTASWVGTGDRTLHFRLTARDGVHGVSQADTTLTVVPTAGPFRVTSPATGTALGRGATETITWNVAGTNLAPIGVANVKISLSRDGGLTYPDVLAASTPNDGAQTVTMPDVASSHVRVRIEAIGNAFFDVSHGDAVLEYSPAVTNDAAGGRSLDYSDALAPVTVTASDADGDGSGLHATASGLPSGLTLTQGPASSAGTRPGTRTFTVSGDATASPGTYPVTITVTDASGSQRSSGFTVVVAPENATATYTGDGAAEGRQGTATLAADVAEVADGAAGDIGTATVTFSQRGTVLCGPIPVTRRADGTGTASCQTSLGGGTHPIDVHVGGNYTAATNTTLAGANPALCDSSVVLTGLSRKGSRVRISGFAERRFAGMKARVTANGRVVARPRVKSDGSFTARARAPKGRHAGLTRYRAQVGGRRSPALRLGRQLTLTSITRTTEGTRVRGRLSGRNHARRKLSVVRAVDCASQRKVTTLRTDGRGRFSVTLPRPRKGTTAVYRVRTAGGTPRSFSLPVVIVRK